MAAVTCFTVSSYGAPRPWRTSKRTEPQYKQSNGSIGFGAERRKEPLWQCVEGCGACCKLYKGPAFPSPEEIFTDPSVIEMYRSQIGPDGWCIHYEKNTRKCSIYSDRPFFCRVEPQVFQSLYGVKKNKFNKEACRCCRDAIKDIYGSDSKELHNFNRHYQKKEKKMTYSNDYV